MFPQLPFRCGDIDLFAGLQNRFDADNQSPKPPKQDQEVLFNTNYRETILPPTASIRTLRRSIPTRGGIIRGTLKKRHNSWQVDIFTRLVYFCDLDKHISGHLSLFSKCKCARFREKTWFWSPVPRVCIYDGPQYCNFEFIEVQNSWQDRVLKRSWKKCDLSGKVITFPVKLHFSETVF